MQPDRGFATLEPIRSPALGFLARCGKRRLEAAAWLRAHLNNLSSTSFKLLRRHARLWVGIDARLTILQPPDQL